MKRLVTSLLLVLTFSVAASAQSKGATTLEGVVVCCEDCWGEADRATTPFGTRADLRAAAVCVANGDPTLLAVANPGGGFTLYELKTGRYDRPGKNWLEFVGKRIAVTGAVDAKKGRPSVKVDTLTVLAEPVAATEPEPEVVGTHVDLSLKDLFGVDQSLASLQGRIVVLNFWATWCLPCRKEMPDLATIQNEYAALGVQVVGASADSVEDREKVLRFVKESKLNFPIWLGASTADMERFGLGVELPGTVVIGRDGKIVATFKGVVEAAELRERIDTLLAAAERESRELIAEAPKRAASVPS